MHVRTDELAQQEQEVVVLDRLLLRRDGCMNASAFGFGTGYIRGSERHRQRSTRTYESKVIGTYSPADPSRFSRRPSSAIHGARVVYSLLV
jgi:hypothetical protein